VRETPAQKAVTAATIGSHPVKALTPGLMASNGKATFQPSDPSVVRVTTIRDRLIIMKKTRCAIPRFVDVSEVML